MYLILLGFLFTLLVEGLAACQPFLAGNPRFRMTMCGYLAA